MRICPSCNQSWSEDRFNPSFPECFRCRSQSVAVSFGVRGKAQFHDITIKEYNDRQVREARANGLDPVPAHSAGGFSPLASGVNKLKAVSESLIPGKVK